MSEDEKIKVIYIAGSGFSGSTLLNKIIGSSSKAFSLGELKFFGNFYKNIFRKKILSHSSFWAPVVEEVKDKKINPPRNRDKIKLDRFFYSLVKGSISNYNKDEHSFLKIVLKRCRQTKGEQVEFLVDSSKTLSRLFLLNSNPNIEVYVVHLVRDGRGFLYSSKKRGKNLAFSFLSWIKGNFLISSFTYRCIDKDKKIRIGYELFTKNPNHYIKSINEKFGLNINPEKFLKIINRDNSYIFAGNAIKSEKLKEIKTDQTWEQKFSLLTKLFLSIITYIPNKLWVYGYK